jgi:NADPH-dependent glutamate synthase beta subunit-like oxidoreductase/NAD(P)H-flavin reductase
MQLEYKKLYNLQQLEQLDKEFQQYIANANSNLHSEYLKARTSKTKKNDTISLQLAPYVEDFLANLFGINNETQTTYANHSEYALIAVAKRQFVQRYAIKKYHTVEPEWHSSHEFKNELNFANICLEALNNNSDNLEDLAKYAAWATISEQGKQIHKNSNLFFAPQAINVEFVIKNIEFDDGYYSREEKHRNGFQLTDQGMSNESAASESHYCIICHDKEKDSCRTGLKNTQKHGCPLDENVSVMHALKRDGLNIAALAVVMVDNPMVAATGHRICNDCMVACIFQKQDPVDTPAVETNILQSVLDYSYGFEIYSLLMRWNPLNFEQPLPKNDSGYKVLVTGLGPSGFSMAHYLARDGHFVLGIDGSKLEPLPDYLMEENLISKTSSIYESLDDKILWGFGGVSEYGITVRWNKNFLKVLRLALARNHNIKFLGSTRFGSQINNDNLNELGFDEVVFCTGAGAPKIANLLGNQLPGVRLASDFLMNLQSTGAFRKDLLINLQLLTPIIVIGGGLSAIDAATEAKAYFEAQREKFFKLYNNLVNIYGADKIQKWWTPKDFEAFENLQNNLVADVKIIYRSDITKSPSYQQNANEIEHALKEGVIFQDHTTPMRFESDTNGWVSGVWVSRNDKQEFMPAKSIVLALGTEHLEQQTNQFTYGDANPDYAGSVVKAIASAKYGYVDVAKKLESNTAQNKKINWDFFDAKIIDILKPADNIVEICVLAPLAASTFRPGQFYKLQNFEVNAKIIANFKMLMEPIALTPKRVDKKNGIINFAVVNIGSSSAMVSLLQKGEKISLMGPIGKPVETLKNKTILLIGGGQFNLGMIEIAKALKKNNNKIFWLAGYRSANEMLYAADIKKYADKLWICTQTTATEKIINGTVVDGLQELQTNQLLHEVDQILIYGTTPMQKAVKKVLLDFNFTKSILCNMNLPMQCMLQGICGQCLCISTDQTKIFCCKEQDINLHDINFSNVENRSFNNGLLEKVSRMWLNHILPQN